VAAEVEADRPWLMAFFMIYDGRSMDIFGNGGISKKTQSTSQNHENQNLMT
jgi:hypothetical protein